MPGIGNWFSFAKISGQQIIPGLFGFVPKFLPGKFSQIRVVGPNKGGHQRK